MLSVTSATIAHHNVGLTGETEVTITKNNFAVEATFNVVVTNTLALAQDPIDATATVATPRRVETRLAMVGSLD